MAAGMHGGWSSKLGAHILNCKQREELAIVGIFKLSKPASSTFFTKATLHKPLQTVRATEEEVSKYVGPLETVSFKPPSHHTKG